MMLLYVEDLKNTPELLSQVRFTYSITDHVSFVSLFTIMKGKYYRPFMRKKKIPLYLLNKAYTKLIVY